MAGDLETVLRFTGDIANAEAGINSLIDALQQAAKQSANLFSQTASGRAGTAGFDAAATAAQKAATAAKQATDSSLAYAQASARLQVAQGNAAGAVATLQNALSGVNQQSVAAVRTQTQLVGIEAQVANAAGKAETAILREAQAVARLQQISGNTPAAIKTLTAALQNASNPNSLSAIRVQLQKTYLETNYNNSPLISAIRSINAGFGQVSASAQAVNASVGSVFSSLGGISLGLGALSAASVKAAIDIDRNVNVLKAFTGSAANAEKRLQELIETAQKTPGLTTALATTLDAQLRVANVTEAAINKVLPAIGRLNAVSSLGDAQKFAQNLIQLVTQNFEKIDLKELVGQSPLAGDLIKQIFNVDSPINSEAIRASAQKLGITTTDAFFTAFANAAATNTKLGNITESLATQFDKLQDRITVALRPIGLAIIQTFAPVVEAVVKVVEAIGAAFGQLSPAIQSFTVVVAAAGAVFLAIPAALGPVGLAITGVAAVVAAATVAWQNYQGAAERAAAITTSGVREEQKSIEQLKGLHGQVEALAASQDGSATQHQRLQDILKQLDPNTRTYIQSIGNEQEAIAELNRVLKEQLNLKQEGLGNNLADLGDAAAELEHRIAALKDSLKFLTDSAEQFRRSGGQVELFKGEALGPKTAEEFGKAINNVQQQIKGAEEAFASFGGKVATVNPLIEKNRDAFIEEQRALGRSEDQITGAIRAFDAFKKQLSGTTSFINDQSSALDALLLRIEKLGTQAKGVVEGKIREIVLTARNAAEAKQKVQEALKLNDDFFFGVQEQRRIAANKAATDEILDINGKVAKRQAAAGAAAAKRAAEAERAASKQDTRALQDAEKQIELISRATQTRLNSDLQDQRISLEDFTARAIALDRQLAQARLASIEEQRQAALRGAKTGAEKTRVNADFDLKRDQALLDGRLAIEARENELRRTIERAEEEHQRRLFDIREIGRRAQITQIEAQIREGQRQAQVGIDALSQLIESQRPKFVEALSPVAGQRKLIEIERQTFDERARFLQDELNKFINNRQERQRINDEMRKLAEERAAFEQKASLDIIQAQEEETQRVIKAVQDRINKINEEARGELERRASEGGRAIGGGSLADAFGQDVAERIVEMEQALGRTLTLWEQNQVAAQTYAQALQNDVEAAVAKVVDVQGLLNDSIGKGLDAFINSGGSLKSAGQAIKQALISPFIEIARVYAKFYLAKSIAAFAGLDFRGGVLYGLAAAGFAALGAIGTAAIGGGGGSTGAAISGGARSEAGSNGPRTIDQGGPLPNRGGDQKIVIQIRAETEEGVIVRRVIDNARNNGEIRQLIQQQSGTG